jgi:RNA polymerase sigma factor (TIGR02999 family)
MSELTELLNKLPSGEGHGLWPDLYHELRRMAAAQMAREMPGHTLQPTALVHEAWLKLASGSWENRRHFFAAASEAMRRILVENARRKLRLKRGGDRERVEWDESAIQPPMEDEKILQVHEALEILQQEDPEKAQVVKLRVFVGLQHAEIAALLGVNEKTIRRHWEFAKVRLFQIIQASA